jgi:CBS domain-containing protein
MATTAEALLKKKASDVVFSVRPNQTTYEALQLMAEHDIGAIAVKENGKLLGILTERDYARKIVLHGKASRHTPVRETMNVNYPAVTPKTTLDACMRLISESRFRYVAVIDGERLSGLISIGDIVKHIIAAQQAQLDHLERYISGL